MTQKHFEAIAAIFAGDLATSNPDERAKLVKVIYSLSDYFQRENPRFNRRKFYDACGVRYSPNTPI